MNKGNCIGLVSVALLLPVSGLHADRGVVNADGAGETEVILETDSGELRLPVVVR